MNLTQAHKVLVAPLNWGLGHATRCVPIIEFYLNKGAQVHLASDGEAGAFLGEKYPNLAFHPLPSLTIKYGNGNVFLALLKQLPEFWKHLKADQLACEALQKAHNFDLIISDSRYGFRSAKTKCIFVSHQLYLQPKAVGLLPSLFLSKYINRFNEVWVPDEAQGILSGALSKDTFINIPIQYIGYLSRFSNLAKADVKPQKNSIPVILSGPYPSKEEMFIKCLLLFKKHPEKTFIVFTSANLKLQNGIPKNVQVHIQANDAFMWKALCESEKIICSAGYSTLMELAVLTQIPKYLIPKKGQSEQVYLSKYLNGKLGFKTLKKGSHF